MLCQLRTHSMASAFPHHPTFTLVKWYFTHTNRCIAVAQAEPDTSTVFITNATSPVGQDALLRIVDKIKNVDSKIVASLVLFRQYMDLRSKKVEPNLQQWNVLPVESGKQSDGESRRVFVCKVCTFYYKLCVQCQTNIRKLIVSKRHM